MARTVICVKDSQALYKMVINDIDKYKNYKSWIDTLQNVINEYTYSIKQHNMWMNAKPITVKGNKGLQTMYNGIAAETQKTGKSIYSDSADRAKWQAEAIVKAISDKVNEEDAKTQKSVLKKIETRMKKMM